MALYLTGGGDQENFHKLDKHFIDSLPQGARIGIIPHATDNYDDALERIQQDFQSNKVRSFTLALDASEELLEYDALMIEGGNTFELIKSMRQSSFFSMLKRFFQTGRPIYADSAGAIMLGSDVQTAFLGDDADEDSLRLQDYRGLDLIPPWAVHAHATPDEYDDLTNLLYDKGNPILALSEETGILINGEEITCFGTDSLELITFAGRKTLNAGESASSQQLQA